VSDFKINREYFDWEAKLAAKDEEIARLETALVIYGRHLADCPRSKIKGSGSCACGLSKAFSQTRSKRHERTI
jgi:hypothetical protein